MNRRWSAIPILFLSLQVTAGAAGRPQSSVAPKVDGVAAQPLVAQVRRLSDALDLVGSPLSSRTRRALDKAARETDDRKAVGEVQAALDPLCLFVVEINPESRVHVLQGAAKPELVEQGWRSFLVKVHNQAGVTAPLRVFSPNALPLAGSPSAELRDRWTEMRMFDSPPMQANLSGLELEYRLVSFYSRDAGQREAKIGVDVGQGTQDLGFRGETDVLFHAQASRNLTFHVVDEYGKPTIAMFLIKDAQGRVYPSQAKRLAPDFAFQPQVYRQDGETLKLPPGTYTVLTTRGPEYLPETRTLVMANRPETLSVQLRRWIDPSHLGWWSGDHHIHAAGCAHYADPTQGVLAADMARHCRGEDLKVGCNLTWGPCFDFQKQFFTGKEDKASVYPYLLRYDIEVSGFGSHQSGHLVLLRLKSEIYPGGDSDKHWPTLCLNTLRWAKAQGAVCGPAHSGNGLVRKFNRSKNLPDYGIPPFDGIGAMEYIADVTQEIPGPDGKMVPAVDFLSTADTAYLAELNIWYHTLNCGYRTRVSGETDFPCITGERVGVGRSYVKLDGKLDYDSWCEGIRQGRCYVSDGRSHLMEFAVNGLGVGEKGSEVDLPQAGTVRMTAKVAALLSTTPDLSVNKADPYAWPIWHLERARIGDTREVPVEVVVNGYPVARQNLLADGTQHDMAFDVPIAKSSWVALRILGSSHTNPVFVIVDGKPIRASKRSAEWCLKCVDQCWSQKQRFIAPGEMDEAKRLYDSARETYRRILAECADE